MTLFQSYIVHQGEMTMKHTKTKAPFRYDIVGSFLRPAALMKMREAYAAGNAGAEELRATEDAAIRDLVATVKIVDKVDFGAHPFLGHFRFLNDLAGDALAKMTIPSPSMLHLICCVRATDYAPIERYEDEARLFEDIALAYQKAVRAFYEAGCRYLQLDDTSWGEFCDPEKRKAYEARGFDLDKIERAYVTMINRVLEAKPADMTITMHICRGNFRSTWFSSGGYEPVAEILFGGCHVDGFFLEYDSDRAGGFDPLKHIKNQRVVLGLVTSKTADLEDKDDIKKRIEEAAKFVPLDQLCLSPQCGFSSTEEGNILTEDDQWKKLRLIREIAEEVWQ